MLVERIIDARKVDGLGKVALDISVRRRLDGERLQPGAGSLLAQEHFVQLGEQAAQPQKRSLAGLGPGHVGSDVALAVPATRLAPGAEGLDSAPVAYLDLGQLRPEFARQTLRAQARRVSGNFVEDERPTPLVAARGVPGDVDLCSFAVMGDVVHLGHVRPRIEQIEDEVFATVDRMCLRVGELLYEAKLLDPSAFAGWVKERMPFGYDTARRLVAIHLAYRELPAEKVAQLPRPWQALYALAPHARGNLAEALDSGDIGPNTTVAEARERARKWGSKQRPAGPLEQVYGTADRRAGALMEFRADDLNPYVRDALSRWLRLEVDGAENAALDAGL